MARCLLGAVYLAGGLVPFTHFADLNIPNPEAGQFMQALVVSDMLKVSKSIEVVAGLALLANQWVPLALSATWPVLVFIAWVDWYLDPFPAGIAAVAMLVGCQVLLTWAHWGAFRALFLRKGAL